MSNNNLNVSMTLKVSPEIAFKAITNVRGWWATNASGETNENNSHFSVRFGKTFADIVVTEFVPGKTITWQIIDSLVPLFNDPTEWNNTFLKWQLFQYGDALKISMTHVGLTPEKECYFDCQKGWTFYVTESLRKLITEGMGMPGTGIFSYIIIGKKRHDGLLYFKNDPLPEYPDGHIYLDVKTTKGEQVTSVYSVASYQKEKFKPLELSGDYFMILEEIFVSKDKAIIQQIRQTLL